MASLESELRLSVTNKTALDKMLELTASLTQASEMAAANLTEISEKISLSGLDSSHLISNIQYYDYFRFVISVLYTYVILGLCYSLL